VSTRALNSINQSEIDRWITAPRFRAFLEAAEGDQSQAMALYDWNVSVSAAFFEVLSYSEILLRNAIDAQFAPVEHSQPATESWLYDPSILTPKSLEKVTEATENIERARKEPTRARVVANLSFGFWRALLNKRYKQLWIETLHDAFPNGNGDRAQVASLLAKLNPFRNRLAHHEPIISASIEKHHEDLLELTRLIDADAADWIQARSCVALILDWRPPLRGRRALLARAGMPPRTTRFHLHR
jgi:hypothetical protein